MNLFKKKDTDLNDNIKLLQDLKKEIRKIKNIYGESEKYPIVNDLKEICKTCDKIIDEVSLNQDKIKKINKFINYYIPALIKILEQYMNIKKNKLSDCESKEMVVKIEKMLSNVHNSFNVILNQLFNNQNIDIDAEIKVLLGELEGEKKNGDL